ncbi:hypothetical protein GCM10010448_44380 [Streptomyces glomeratus]|uniref:Uncharacterized protein n=1 Tax=Streptomyces glomeratus TaxID=284452 RepID=A0ABP6LQL3_9ACTN
MAAVEGGAGHGDDTEGVLVARLAMDGQSAITNTRAVTWEWTSPSVGVRSTPFPDGVRRTLWERTTDGGGLPVCPGAMGQIEGEECPALRRKVPEIRFRSVGPLIEYAAGVVEDVLGGSLSFPTHPGHT